MSSPTLLSPNGYTSSTCGYCSPPGARSSGPTSKKYGLIAPQMSCQFYQDAIDRGWRRSGTYFYHPDMARTCCPQYTIRLDATAYIPTKKHRQVINRFNRYLWTGAKPGEQDAAATGKVKSKDKGKGKAKGGDDLLTELRAYEEGHGEAGQHRYTTELVAAKATTETFELYKKYQIAVHNDPPSKVTVRGFERFLCSSPLLDTPIKYASGAKTEKLPSHYGSYHLLYRVDGQLVGISVIDILPLCVSSVYFIWDPEWAWASLGKLSAIREIALARDIRAGGAEDVGWVYMGYWIAGCQKMRYKSEYSPSFLLDPGTNAFHPLDPALDKFLQAHPQGYYPFADIDHTKLSEPLVAAIERNGDGLYDEMSDEESMDEFPAESTPGFAEPSSYSEEEIDELLVFMKGRGGNLSKSRVVPVSALQFVDDDMVRREIREMVAAVGIGYMAGQGVAPSDLLSKGFLFFG